MAKPYLEEGCADTCIHFEDDFIGRLVLGLLEAEKLDQLNRRLEGCQPLFDFRVVLGQIKIIKGLTRLKTRYLSSVGLSIMFLTSFDSRSMAPSKRSFFFPESFQS
jgi:hypothetical protein